MNLFIDRFYFVLNVTTRAVLDTPPPPPPLSSKQHTSRPVIINGFITLNV